jgi:hypothetical protein
MSGLRCAAKVPFRVHTHNAAVTPPRGTRPLAARGVARPTRKAATERHRAGAGHTDGGWSKVWGFKRGASRCPARRSEAHIGGKI